MNWKTEFEKALVSENKNTDVVKTITVGNNSSTHLCRLWDGIAVWANNVHIDYIGYPDYAKDWSYIVLNICHRGRCEVGLQDKRYIYMTPGSMCISDTMPEDGYAYPGELYEGIEIAFDKNRIGERWPSELSAYGIEMIDIEEYLKVGANSYMALLSEETLTKSQQLFDALCKGKTELSAYRFYVLELLFLIKNGGSSLMRNGSLVTKGQRHIAVETEKILVRDLKQHHTIEEIAKLFDISPSALKKYFEAVYGMPVSHYVREKKMRKAMELLKQPGMSVGNVALSCGYENQGKFGAVFKAYTGQSPMEYRRLHKNNL